MNDLYKQATLKDLEKIVANEPINAVNGKCTRCGNCCTHHLPLFPSEITEIKTYIKTNNIKPSIQIKPPADQPDACVVDFTCPFLNQTGPVSKCLIYDIRPTICRTYICDNPDAGYDAFSKKAEEESKRLHIPILKLLADIQTEINVQQEFFPTDYTPKVGDVVVVNNKFPAAHAMYGNKMFLTISERNYDDQKELLLITKEESVWLDVKGLSIVHNFM